MPAPDPSTASPESCINYLRGLTSTPKPEDATRTMNREDSYSRRPVEIIHRSDTFDPINEWVEIPVYRNDTTHRASWTHRTRSTFLKRARAA